MLSDYFDKAGLGDVPENQIGMIEQVIVLGQKRMCLISFFDLRPFCSSNGVSILSVALLEAPSKQFLERESKLYTPHTIKSSAYLTPIDLSESTNGFVGFGVAKDHTWPTDGGQDSCNRCAHHAQNTSSRAMV